jgi:N-acetylmuramoyl-L-alanine amidase
MKILFFVLFAVSGLILKAQTICIDPGHGYGANGEDIDGRTREEITTNCDVGLILRDSLESAGYTVIMTREDSDSGSWMSLTQRAELADEYESDRLLSIHCNAGGGTGTETFWCYRGSPNRAIDSTLSALVQDNMTIYGDWKSRRSIEDNKYLGFHLGVLKGSSPGCLNEIGFVDSPGDLDKLLDTQWRKNFAKAYRIAIDQSFVQDYPSKLNREEYNSFKVFPNPFDQEITLSVNDNHIFVISLEILSQLGQVIHKETNMKPVQGSTYVIDTRGLQNGIYFLRVQTPDKNICMPLIK